MVRLRLCRLPARHAHQVYLRPPARPHARPRSRTWRLALVSSRASVNHVRTAARDPASDAKRGECRRIEQVLHRRPPSGRSELLPSRRPARTPSRTLADPFFQAAWTKDRWASWGIKSPIVSYDTYLNYPLGHRLALLTKPNASREDGAPTGWTVAYEAPLAEDVLPEDPTTALDDRVPTFHGYSASGNVPAPIVYVNYGTYEDFEDLQKAGVALQGKIAIARYGSVFRGLKVKRAQELGMVGVITYSDPGEDGAMTEEKGLAPYPDGPARQPSSVQRGSMQFVSVRPGDP